MELKLGRLHIRIEFDGHRYEIQALDRDGYLSYWSGEIVGQADAREALQQAKAKARPGYEVYIRDLDTGAKLYA